MHEQNDQKPHYLIIGGGLGGASLALGLLKKGMRVSLFDKASSFREIGTGIVLAPNGLRALHAMHPEAADELGSYYGKAGSPNCPFVGMNGAGEKIGELTNFNTDRDYLDADFSMLRSTIHKTLIRWLPEEILHHSKKLIRATEDSEGVTAFFEDGTEVRGDYLIGCDGRHSILRKQFCPQDKLEYMGLTSVRGTVRLPEDTPYKNGFLCIDRDNELVMFVAALHDSPGDFYWSIVLDAKEGVWPAKGQEELKQSLYERIGDSNQVVAGLLDVQQPEKMFSYDMFALKSLGGPWSTARMTLLGDAAHPVSPFLGQGMNTAFEDSCLLYQLLSNAKSPEATRQALQEYEKQRLPRMTLLMKFGWKRTLGAVYPSFLDRVKHPLLKWGAQGLKKLSIPYRIFQNLRYVRLIYKYKPPALLSEAGNTSEKATN